MVVDHLFAPVLDEVPRSAGEIHLRVVALDISHAIQNSRLIEAEAFVVAGGPDGATGIQVISHRFFRTFCDFANVVIRRFDEKMQMPDADGHCENGDVEPVDQFGPDPVADIKTLIGLKVERFVFHPRPVGGFELWILRKDFAVLHPAPFVAAEPRSVCGEREHDRQCLTIGWHGPDLILS